MKKNKKQKVEDIVGDETKEEHNHISPEDEFECVVCSGGEPICISCGEVTFRKEI